MKQVQIEESRFPKLASVNDNSSPQTNQKRKRSSAHSQMIRIIIALLIAIFIYNESQQTTINYNQIIKNQKMFIVKNIRGVIPTLSGNLKDLQDKWKVVHFQNYRYNESEMLANFTLIFNKTHLIVENMPCNIKIVYDWKNYSYNIDLAYLSQSQAHTVKVSTQQPYNNTQKQKTTQIQPSKNSNSPLRKVDPNVSSDTNSGPQSTQQIFIQPSQKLQNVVQKIPKSPQSSESNQTKAQCQKTVNYFKQVIMSTSVWTISGVNLYLLLQNELYKQDFYMILQPYTD